jgi:pumilio family protein 6
MELLFTTLSNTQFAQLKLEFYGPHVSLFSSDTNIASVTLQTCLKQHPDHETTIKEFLFTHVLQKCMDKNLYGMAFVQQLLWEYSQCLPDLQTMWIPNLVDHALQLISTRPGAHVVSQCAAYGTAKDRKRLLKAFKGYVRSSLLHKHAHLPILQLVLSTDDTVSVGKSLMAELLVMPNKKISVDDDLNKEDEEVSPLLDLALDEYASKLFLLLLHNSPDEQRKCLDPLDQVELNPQIDGAPTSKKNVDTRRLECLQPLREALIELCRQHAAQLLAVPTGSRVLERAVLTWPQDLIDALAKACRDEALWDHAVGHLAIKHLLQVSSDFARAVVLPSEILSSRAAFCVASWVEHQPAKDSIQQIKAPQIEKAMKEAKKHGQATAGFEALLKVVNSGGKRETEKSKKTKQ